MSLWLKESIKNTLNLHFFSSSIHLSSKFFPVWHNRYHSICTNVILQCLFYFWRQKCGVSFHSNTSDEMQGRNEASRRALCTKASKLFICWLLKAACVCFAVCTLTLSAALVYITSLQSFHHKTLFYKMRLNLLNLMLDFYSQGVSGE